MCGTGQMSFFYKRSDVLASAEVHNGLWEILKSSGITWSLGFTQMWSEGSSSAGDIQANIEKRCT